MAEKLGCRMIDLSCIAKHAPQWGKPADQAQFGPLVAPACVWSVDFGQKPPWVISMS